MGWTINQRAVLLVSVAVLFAVSFLALEIQPADACYGPSITSDIDKTQILLNQTVTVTGKVCPAAENKTVRIAYTRPDYTYIEQYILTDPVTGNFSATMRSSFFTALSCARSLPA